MVVFVAGENPIKGTQILYFLDPLFRQARRRSRLPPAGSTKSRTGKGFQGMRCRGWIRRSRLLGDGRLGCTGRNLWSPGLPAADMAGLRLNVTALDAALDVWRMVPVPRPASAQGRNRRGLPA